MSKINYKVVGLWAAAGAVLWVLHGVAVRIVLEEGPFSNTATPGETVHEVTDAVLFVAAFLVAGAIVSAYLSRRRRAEAALRESEERFSKIFQDSPVGIALTAWEDGRILDANPASLRTLGFTREEVLGRTTLELRIWADPARRQAIRDEALQRGYAPEREVKYRTKGGEVREVLASIRAVDIAGQKCMLSFFRDITEDKRTAETLRQTNQALEAVIQASPLAILITDDQGKVRRWNPAAEGIFGWRQEEVLGQTPPFMPPEKMDEFRGLVARVVRGESLAGLELRRRRKDGSTVDISLSTAPLRDAAGLVTGIMAIIADVSERKQTVEALRQQRDFTALLVETAPSVVLVLDPEGRIVLFNRFVQELTGYRQEEVKGKDWFELFLAPAVARIQRENLRRALREATPEKTYENVHPIVTRAGREPLIHWYVSMLRDAQGAVTGVLCLGHDITEMRQKEEQLRQAAKMEAIGRLAGGIAHDFNNMLAIIQGYADLLGKSAPSEVQHRADLEKIRDAARRAAALTGQLLAFARKQAIRPRVLNLNDSISVMESMLKRVIGEDVELTAALAGELWAVQADPTQIEQVLMNLTVNAREAMPNGGRLALQTANVLVDEARARREGLAPGEYVLLAVADTGVGMDEEVMAHLFEPFYTTKEGGKNTGLGLPTCYGIVTQSGGHIAVESKPGKGTAFRIYLPRFSADRNDGPPPAPQQEPAADLPRTDETVLVAEDDASVRELTCRLLRQQGYQVLEAASAEQALEMAARLPAGSIDLLVTDVIMPRTPGDELAGRLQAAHPDLKVLYVSGYAEAVAVGRGIGQNGVDFLPKPFTAQQLASAVRRALRQGETKAPKRTQPGAAPP